MAQVLGAIEINKRLRALPDKMRAAMREALHKGADELVATQKHLAPVGPTGNLRESIRKEQGEHELEVLVVAGGEKTTREVRKGSGKPYDYALAQEFGTVEQPAQPFFYGPFRLGKKRNVRRLKRSASKAAKEAARG